MLVVLVGGARAGKSALAADLAYRRKGEVTYIATGEAGDDEMRSRIERHRAERPAEWTTVEEPLRLREALAALDDGALAVVDCLTLWVANLLKRGDSEQAIVEEAEAVATAARARAAPVVVVTNEVGLGIVPATPSGRVYRDLLGRVNSTFVAHADRAGFVVAGRLLPLDPPAALGDWAWTTSRG
jgi:adenosylcobinamide kinase / adenosylcobinamide-phosphate guanylyltransferase